MLNCRWESQRGDSDMRLRALDLFFHVNLHRFRIETLAKRWDPWGLKSSEGRIILSPSLGGTATVLGRLHVLLLASSMQTTRSTVTTWTPLVIFQVPISVRYSNDALQTFADMLCLFSWSSPYKMYSQAIVSNNLVSVHWHAKSMRRYKPDL